MKKYISLEFPSSSVCNLDCSYCYIPKNKELKKIENQWKYKLKDGTFFDIVSEYYTGEDLENITFWGAEPSIGFKQITNIEGIFKQFPKIRHLATSSNFTNIENHKELFTRIDLACKKFSIKNMNFDLQISLDGPELLNDKNRGKGTFNKITENIEKIIDFINFNIKYFKISIHIKSTNIEENYYDYVNDPNILINYIQNFSDLHEKYVINKNFNKNIRINLTTLPTLALPGNYTKEDGIIFFKYHKVLDKIKKENNIKYMPYNDQYLDRVLELLKTSNMINRFNGNEKFQCSAGVAQQCIDPDGTTHGCHASFWNNYESYLNSSQELTDWTEGRRILNFDANMWGDITKAITSEYRNTFDFSRLDYILSGYASDITLKQSSIYNAIKWLTIANQLNPIYRDDNWAKLFAVYLALKSECWANNVYTTGSLYIMSNSVIKMFGNGLFEYMINKLLYKED